MKKAFTLIEFLVVVLIIGILAAIALPNYQRAVIKSRAAEALSKINVLYQSLERYQMVNDEFPDFGTNVPSVQQLNDALDVELNLGPGFSVLYYRNDYAAIKYNRAGTAFNTAKGLIADNANPIWRKGITSCWASGETSKGAGICKSLCGELAREFETNDVYYCVLK